MCMISFSAVTLYLQAKRIGGAGGLRYDYYGLECGFRLIPVGQ